MTAPLTVDVIQASEDALAAWIASQLPDVTVNDEWPTPGVPFKAGGEVTVLHAGACVETDVPPYVIKQVDDPFDVNSTFFWKVTSCEQPLQLDVWTTSKARRSDLINRLGNALTAGMGLSLSAAYLASVGASANRDPVSRSLSLQLAPPWDHLVAAYWFESPDLTDTPASSKRREFRATYSGAAFFDRTVARVSPRMTSISLPLSAGPTAPPAPLVTLTVASTATPENPASPPTTTITRP
jgi:hypothetical protein